MCALGQEIANGETELWADPPWRVVRVVKMMVRRSRSSRDLLYEVAQEMRDGRRRARNQLPSEKMGGEETVQEAVRRGLREEMGAVPNDVQFVHIAQGPEIEEKCSLSFPGLRTQY